MMLGGIDGDPIGHTINFSSLRKAEELKPHAQNMENVYTFDITT